MRRGVKTGGGLLCWAVILLGGRPARGETLDALLARILERQGLDVSLPEDLDLSQDVDGACLHDGAVFGLAYRIVETVGGSGRYGDSVSILLLDKRTATWTHGEISLKAIDRREWVGADLCGSLLHFHRSASFYYLGFHLTPSACSTLVLAKDFSVHRTLYGWIVGISPKEKVFYQESMRHFAATHPARIWVYDPHSDAHQRLFPWTTLGPIRKAYVEKVRKCYDEIGQDWFRVHNHPMDPERTDSGLAKSDDVRIAIDDRTDSVAFIMGFSGLDLDATRKLKYGYFSGLSRELRSLPSEGPSRRQLQVLDAVLGSVRRRDVDRQKALEILAADREIHDLVEAALRDLSQGSDTDARERFHSLDPRWSDLGLWERLRDLIYVPESKGTHILFLYRNVLRGEETTYEEFALEDLREQFQGASDREILEALVTPQLR